MESLYDTDFYSWSMQQADLVRQGRFSELDIDNLIEEIEDMGKSQYRTLTSALGQLLMHLLKWQMQSARDDQHSMEDWHNSWQISIGKQRPDIRQVFQQNPGLKSQLDESYAQAYQWARERAAVELRCNKELFPKSCPWTFEQVMQENFLPS